MKQFLPAALLVAVGVPAVAQTAAQFEEPLTHVRIEHPQGLLVAEQFEQDGFDVVEGSPTETSVELIVSNAAWAELLRLGFDPEVIAVSRPFDEIQAERAAEAMDRGEGPEPDMPPAGYENLGTILGIMQDAETNYPAIAQHVDLNDRFSIANTAGNRRMFAVKISDNVASEEDEPAMLIYTAAHCREIVTPVIALEAIEQLTTNYGTDPLITSLVDNNEIWVIPVANPDGYAYVFSTNNFWRKNRRNNGNGTFGVDLNRNYSFGWSSACAGSTNSGSDTYKGEDTMVFSMVTPCTCASLLMRLIRQEATSSTRISDCSLRRKSLSTPRYKPGPARLPCVEVVRLRLRP